MAFGIMDGIGKMFGAVGDVIKAPFKLVGGAAEAALGLATLPIRLPLMLMQRMFTPTQAGLQGSQAAMGQYMNRSPGYW